jgi:hypothetical protein
VNTRIDAIIPLAVLEAVRRLDEGGLEGLEDRKLGTSNTVAAQIARYGQLAQSGGCTDAAETSQLFRLVGRRPDAKLVLSDAGRYAAQRALMRMPRSTRLARRLAPGALRVRLGVAGARRIAEGVFGIGLTLEEGPDLVAEARAVSESIDSGASACEFFGSAIAEILRGLTPFGGVMLHESCRARGDLVCRWRSGDNQWW